MRTLRMVVFVLVQWTPWWIGAMEIIQISNQNLRRRQPLASWEQQEVYTRAREHIGLMTQKVTELRLYVGIHSVPNRQLYVHSNYRPPMTSQGEGPRGETRLIVRGARDMAALIDQILTGTNSRGLEPSQRASVKATLLVEQGVLESPAFRDLDFSEVGTSWAIGDDGQTRRFRGVVAPGQPKVWAVEYAPAVYAPLSEPGRRRPWRYVAQSRLEPGKVRTMSWLMDAAVNETLAQLMPARNITLDWDRAITLEEIEQQFELCAGQTVVVIGALVEGRLVARAADGTDRFSIPRSVLREMAYRFDVRLMLFDTQYIPTTRPAQVDPTVAGETMSRTAMGLARSFETSGTATVLDFISRLTRELAGADRNGQSPVVGLVQAPADSVVGAQGPEALALESTVYAVQWSGDSMHLGEPQARILYIRPIRDPYADKSHVLVVRIGVALLSVFAVGILIGFYVILKRTAAGNRATPGTRQLPIYLYYEPLHELNLTDQTVDDAALKQLSSLPNIKRLHLSGASITDAGLKHIAPCTSLEIVTLRQTAVTDLGITWLRRQLPSCQVFER